MKKTSLLPLLICLALLSCQPERKSHSSLYNSIDSLMISLNDTAQFNGNLLVAKNGKMIYQKSFGFSNYDTKEKLDDSSMFELASVSKQFTAMGIMMLQERGLLAYTDDVRKFVPELPYEGMTIRHFLNHTSGIPDYEIEFSKGWDPKKIAFNDDMINLLAKNKPVVLFKPGEKWEYSNTAYAILATIIERVAKKSFGAFLAENIFMPLHMTRTRIYNTRRSSSEKISNYAFGYIYVDSLKKFVLPDSVKETHFVYTLDGIVGDGTVNSTTGDLFLWNEALYTEALVKKGTLDEAFISAKLNDGSVPFDLKREPIQYGFGWGIKIDSVAGKIVQHSGGWPGYATFIQRYIDNKDCIILLTNNSGRAMRQTLDGISEKLKTQRTEAE